MKNYFLSFDALDCKVNELLDGLGIVVGVGVALNSSLVCGSYGRAVDTYRLLLISRLSG
jgi:hypothetical protein